MSSASFLRRMNHIQTVHIWHKSNWGQGKKNTRIPPKETMRNDNRVYGQLFVSKFHYWLTPFSSRTPSFVHPSSFNKSLEREWALSINADNDLIKQARSWLWNLEVCPSMVFSPAMLLEALREPRHQEKVKRWLSWWRGSTILLWLQSLKRKVAGIWVVHILYPHNVHVPARWVLLDSCMPFPTVRFLNYSNLTDSIYPNL